MTKTRFSAIAVALGVAVSVASYADTPTLNLVFTNTTSATIVINTDLGGIQIPPAGRLDMSSTWRSYNLAILENELNGWLLTGALTSSISNPLLAMTNAQHMTFAQTNSSVVLGSDAGQGGVSLKFITLPDAGPSLQALLTDGGSVPVY